MRRAAGAYPHDHQPGEACKDLATGKRHGDTTSKAGMSIGSANKIHLRMRKINRLSPDSTPASTYRPPLNPQEYQRMIDFNNKGFFKLKQNDEYAERVTALLLDGETVIDSYKSMRDGVVFTNKRIIAVNVQGLTGSKKDFTSLPYKNIVAYSVETSGTFDLDSELEIYFSSLGKVKFEFTGKAAIIEISRLISSHIFA
jgi:hypothetical protein